MKTKLFFHALLLFFETPEIGKNGTFCWFSNFCANICAWKNDLVFYIFNRSWKSCNQIFQNWSYLCTYIGTKIGKSTKSPILFTIYGAKNSFLKKSLIGGNGNWLFWTHFWIPYAILVLKMGICTQEVTSNDFQTLRT